MWSGFIIANCLSYLNTWMYSEFFSLQKNYPSICRNQKVFFIVFYFKTLVYDLGIEPPQKVNYSRLSNRSTTWLWKLSWKHVSKLVFVKGNMRVENEHCCNVLLYVTWRGIILIELYDGYPCCVYCTIKLQHEVLKCVALPTNSTQCCWLGLHYTRCIHLRITFL